MTSLNVPYGSFDRQLYMINDTVIRGVTEICYDGMHQMDLGCIVRTATVDVFSHFSTLSFNFYGLCLFLFFCWFYSDKIDIMLKEYDILYLDCKDLVIQGLIMIVLSYNVYFTYFYTGNIKQFIIPTLLCFGSIFIIEILKNHYKKKIKHPLKTN